MTDEELVARLRRFDVELREGFDRAATVCAEAADRIEELEDQLASERELADGLAEALSIMHGSFVALVVNGVDTTAAAYAYRKARP